MTASQIIAESFLCRQAARNIYPQAPDELFNTCWLTIREMELSDPNFKVGDPKRYFLRAMRNQALRWNKQDTNSIHDISRIKETEIIELSESSYPGQAFINEWLNAPTNDEDLLFLKNILILAMNCKNNNDAIKLIGISHRQYYTYKQLAKQKLYDDYIAANNGNGSSLDLV